MSFSKRIFLACVVATVGLFSTTSCSKQFGPRGDTAAKKIPFTPIDTLKVTLREQPGPTLVEFVQDFNCAQCDQMTPTMTDVRANYSEEVAFHRVSYRAAAQQLGLGICPTYLFFLNGQVVGELAGKQPYPMMASHLNEMLSLHQANADEHSPSRRTENRNEISDD